MNLESQRKLEIKVFDLFKQLNGRYPKDIEERDAWHIYSIMSGIQFESYSKKYGNWQVTDATYAIDDIKNPPVITGVFSCVGTTCLLKEKENLKVLSTHFLDPSAPSLKEKYGLNPRGIELEKIMSNYLRFLQEKTREFSCQEIMLNSKFGPSQDYWNIWINKLESAFPNISIGYVDSINFTYIL